MMSDAERRAAAERLKAFAEIALQGTPSQAPAYWDAANMRVYNGTPFTKADDMLVVAHAYLADCRSAEPPPRDERTWIQTYTGKQVWPLNPRVEDVCVEDVAHALANQCRFTGHTRQFYSVAQHSFLASDHCPEAPLWALLHDAAEAYLCDVSRPVKGYLTNYREAEERLERVIAEKFGLPWPMPEAVKVIDLKLLATERRDLMNTPPIPWVSTRDVEPLAERVVPWPAAVAEDLFLMRFRELTA